MKKALDLKFMKYAIDLAVLGLGKTSPNPAVGAVIVKKGKIIGEGYHRHAGSPHAEAIALRRAGADTHGSDLYVTLEPCCHFGKTPPCCDAIIKSGIKKVIVGTRDPNPLVNGKGIKVLKMHGIEVVEGILENECKNINLAYNKWIISGIPYVIVKAAISMDGKIGMKSGESKWITNEQCRNYVHRLRSLNDAILIGSRTACLDNPRLTVRFNGETSLKPAVILDEKLSLEPKSNLFKRKPGSLIVATTSKAPLSKIRFFEKHGHIVLLCRATSNGYVFLPHLMEKLGTMGITSLLVEGGAEVFSDFLQRNLVDRMVVCIAPKVIGANGQEWLPFLCKKRLKDAISLRNVETKIFGDNVVIEGSVIRR